MAVMKMAELEALAERVRELDPTLDSIWLPADRRLQTRGLSLERVTQELIGHLASIFRGLHEDDFPMHYCAWGKARVGSTAMTNMFGMLGFPSYYQPVKAMLRTAFAGHDPAPWPLPRADQHLRIFTKETQGPYSLGECLFNPLQILVEAGYPPGKLHLIVLDRDPERSLASWLTKFRALQPPSVLQSNYVLAALNVNRVRTYAWLHGIPVTHYAYEASREPLTAARALFARLKLSGLFLDQAVTSWGQNGDLGSASSHRIIYPSEPAIYSPPNLHGSDTCYHYRNGGTRLSDQQRDLLERTGVDEIYRENVIACIGDLRLDMETAARLFGQTVQPDAFLTPLQIGDWLPDTSRPKC